MNGALVPADPIRWPVDAEASQMFALNGWMFAGELGDRELVCRRTGLVHQCWAAALFCFPGR
jgi:hypothetical protein